MEARDLTADGESNSSTASYWEENGCRRVLKEESRQRQGGNVRSHGSDGR